MTVKNLSDIVIYIASFLAAITTVVAMTRLLLSKMFASVEDRLRKMDVRECRKFLIDFLCDVEKGVEKDEVQWNFAHETYDHYLNDLKENSYVHDKWERVVNHGNNE